MTREKVVYELENSIKLGISISREAREWLLDYLEQEPILDKIKEDFITRYPRNYANELELGGRSCVFSLNDILHTIDKYKLDKEET